MVKVIHVQELSGLKDRAFMENLFVEGLMQGRFSTEGYLNYMHLKQCMLNQTPLNFMEMGPKYEAGLMIQVSS